jgi:hypothetical protein
LSISIAEAPLVPVGPRLFSPPSFSFLLFSAFYAFSAFSAFSAFPAFSAFSAFSAPSNRTKSPALPSLRGQLLAYQLGDRWPPQTRSHISTACGTSAAIRVLCIIAISVAGTKMKILINHCNADNLIALRKFSRLNRSRKLQAQT